MVEQTELSGQNKNPEVTHLSTFPDIYEVNPIDSSFTTLLKYLESKVDCFKAGQLRDYYPEWMVLTSDTEILDIVSGQHIEFSQKPFQMFVPQEKKTWALNELETCEIEMTKLLKKGAIVSTEHEEGEFIFPVFTTPKKDGSSRMILNLKCLNKFVEYHHFKMESLSTVGKHGKA